MNSLSEKPIIFTIQPQARDIFVYKMYHSFVSTLGVFRLVFSLIFLVVGFVSLGKAEVLLSVVVIAFGLLNPVVTPIWFWIQSCKAARSRVPTRFCFQSENITVDDGKQRLKIAWDELALVVWLRKELFLYTAANQALVLPKRQMDGCEDALLELCHSCALPNRSVYRKLI